MVASGDWPAGAQQDLDATTVEQGLLCLVVIVGLLAVGFFFCVCCGYKSLKMAIDVIDASADFLAKTKRILLVPGIFFLL
jgi:membrane protein YqaA with SNARE-associated domain